MSSVKGHWREVNGQRVWVSEHMRNHPAYSATTPATTASLKSAAEAAFLPDDASTEASHSTAAALASAVIEACGPEAELRGSSNCWTIRQPLILHGAYAHDITGTGEQVTGTLVTEWEDLGEGHLGEWDENDPDDEPLLRFSVSFQPDDDPADYHYFDNGSYCTNVRSDSDDTAQVALLTVVHNEARRALTAGEGFKRAMEDVSHVESPRD